MIYPMLRATLFVIVSACALNAQVTFDRILRADIETFSEVVRLAGLRPK